MVTYFLGTCRRRKGTQSWHLRTPSRWWNTEDNGQDYWLTVKCFESGLWFWLKMETVWCLTAELTEWRVWCLTAELKEWRQFDAWQLNWANGDSLMLDSWIERIWQFDAWQLSWQNGDSLMFDSWASSDYTLTTCKRFGILFKWIVFRLSPCACVQMRTGACQCAYVFARTAYKLHKVKIKLTTCPVIRSIHTHRYSTTWINKHINNTTTHTHKHAHTHTHTDRRRGLNTLFKKT